VDPHSGRWYLKNAVAAGAPDITPFAYGGPTWHPLAGAWAFHTPALRAEGGAQTAGPTPAALGNANLQRTVAAALTRLGVDGISAGLLARLASLRFEVAHLPAAFLATVDPNNGAVVLETNAAGYGWFIDPTPQTDEEFSADGNALPGGPAAGKIDLLTAILQEMDGVVGLNGGGLTTLSPSTRGARAIEAVFAAAGNVPPS
jgi:hypothetical protein